jgi:hypothetical protein
MIRSISSSTIGLTPGRVSASMKKQSVIHSLMVEPSALGGRGRLRRHWLL